MHAEKTVTVFGLRKWDNRKGEYEYFPFKATTEAISTAEAVPIEGTAEIVEISELDDADRWWGVATTNP